MKKLRLIALALAAAAALAGCGGAASSGAGSAAPADKDYAQILHDARTDEYNEAYLILTPDKTGENTYAAIDGYSADLTAEDLAAQADMLLPMLNLTAGDMEDYAISLSIMNVRAYGVAIIRPAEGKAETVKQGLQAFIEAQKTNMEHYLDDQYAIAKAAQVVETDTGELVLVCSEDSATVLAAIQDALAQ